jgi:hypothetical protein
LYLAHFAQLALLGYHIVAVGPELQIAEYLPALL